MIRIDAASGNFVGAGEDAAVSILCEIFKFEKMDFKRSWPINGIYTQVPILALLRENFRRNLNEIHSKSSIDILLKKAKTKIAFRVEGTKGSLKLQRQDTQRWMLEKSGVKIIDFPKLDMPVLFSDIVNDVSRFEVEFFLSKAGLLTVKCASCLKRNRVFRSRCYNCGSLLGGIKYDIQTMR